MEKMDSLKFISMQMNETDWKRQPAHEVGGVRVHEDARTRALAFASARVFFNVSGSIRIRVHCKLDATRAASH